MSAFFWYCIFGTRGKGRYHATSVFAGSGRTRTFPFFHWHILDWESKSRVISCLFSFVLLWHNGEVGHTVTASPLEWEANENSVSSWVFFQSRTRSETWIHIYEYGQCHERVCSGQNYSLPLFLVEHWILTNYKFNTISFSEQWLIVIPSS